MTPKEICAGCRKELHPSSQMFIHRKMNTSSTKYHLKCARKDIRKGQTLLYKWSLSC